MTDDLTPEDRAFLDTIRKRFDEIAGADASIDPKELGAALGLRDPYYAGRLFAMVDRDGSGEIDTNEFIAFAEKIVRGKEEDRLRFAFDLHDPDDSGEIDWDELHRILSASLAQHGASLPDVAVNGLTDALFRRADTDGDGGIDFAEFQSVLDAYPKLKTQMSRSATAMLMPPPPRPKRGPSLGDRLRIVGQKIASNRAAAVFLLLYAAVNVALFANAMVTYADAGANIYVQIARGGGACLNFNGALILIPMLRHLLTRVRHSVLGEVVPVDHAIAFHKLVGHAMMGFAALHTAAHLANYATLDGGIPAYLLGTSAGLTGLILMIAFLVMWICALDWIRRSGKFELFYFTHMLYLVWFVLALLHGPVFWIWAGVPILGYIAERLIRFRHTRRAFPVSAAEPLPSSVTRLEVKLPDGYKYQPGDYVFVKYPPISKREWHPFTVTTCPEESGILSVHVRGLGNWTKRLHGHAKAQHADLGHAYIDGPYGTPSTHIFKSEVAVLIGAGIGVTPFAAILKSVFRRRAAGDTDLGLKKVHFVWMNRDQYAFEWFSDMISGLEAEDPDGALLDAQVYLTGVKLDVTSATLDVAMDVYHSEIGRDLFTGLRNRTNLDRPDWRAIFRRVAEENPGKQVDVYFCGPAPLAKILAATAADFRFGFHKENF
ncbi:EF-hand domain-containing protein [Pacificispira sp.]|uniref:EF-hand domain-containing protein n=1 Tax=Pacificispira sp. TaxID=2888761 RepID=UPI003BAC86D5